MQILMVVVALSAVIMQGAPSPSEILARYVIALGGEAAVRAVKTRITEGKFDNGRGLSTSFKIVEDAPDRKLTLIGSDAIDGPLGSGRAYDGAHAWDKSFIGTGLRVLEGRELADAARDADLLRPLHLLDNCTAIRSEISDRANVIVCQSKSGGTVDLLFDKRSGLLVGEVIASGARKIHISYDDYRAVGSLKLPFKTHIDVGGAIIKYDADAIRLDQPVDRAVFQQPRQ